MTELHQRAETVLGYTFKSLELLKESLTHASIADNRLNSNERMEFLGDAVLDLVTSKTTKPCSSSTRSRCFARLRSTNCSTRKARITASASKSASRLREEDSPAPGAQTKRPPNKKPRC